jgi:hypothetical protein
MTYALLLHQAALPAIALAWGLDLLNPSVLTLCSITSNNASVSKTQERLNFKEWAE